MEGGLDDAVGAGDDDRAVRIGHAQGLLGREGVTVGVGVVIDVAARGLVAEPFAHVALAGPGGGGQLGGVHGLACQRLVQAELVADQDERGAHRSEEHTSELQSLMRSSYAVFCSKKKKN